MGRRNNSRGVQRVYLEVKNPAQETLPFLRALDEYANDYNGGRSTEIGVTLHWSPDEPDTWECPGCGPEIDEIDGVDVHVWQDSTKSHRTVRLKKEWSEALLKHFADEIDRQAEPGMAEWTDEDDLRADYLRDQMKDRALDNDL